MSVAVNKGLAFGSFNFGNQKFNFNQDKPTGNTKQNTGPGLPKP